MPRRSVFEVEPLLEGISMRNFVTLFLALVPVFGAIAGPKEDIGADMAAGRWPSAERRLVDVLASHPENAMAHYWYAQVLHHEGQGLSARKELEEAKKLDPALHFASNEAVLKVLEKSLPAGASGEQSMGEPAPGPSATVHGTPEALAASAADDVVDQSGGGAGRSAGVWAWSLVLLGCVFAMAIVFVALSRRSKRVVVERQQARDALGAAYDELRDAQKAIDARSDLSMEGKMAASDRVSLAMGDVSKHLSSLGQRTRFDVSRALVARVLAVARDARGYVGAERGVAEPLQADDVRPVGDVATRSPGITVVHANAPSSNDGLVEGLLIGNMLNGSTRHDREIVYERSRIEPAATSFDESLDSMTRNADVDIGGSDSGSSWSTGDSGSIDTGGGSSSDW